VEVHKPIPREGGVFPLAGTLQHLQPKKTQLFHNNSPPLRIKDPRPRHTHQALWPVCKNSIDISNGFS